MPRAVDFSFWGIYASVVFVTHILGRYISNSVIPRDPPRSIFCDFNSSTHSRSSLRDVVFLFATSFAPGLELCIRSLRSTGAGCRIVLFLSPGFPETPEFLNLIEGASVELVRNCDSGPNRPLVPHMLRFEYERKWLRSHDGEVNRIFHTDSFDVFFQGDPFAGYISDNSLQFVVEPHQIRSCGWNLAWMNACYGQEMGKEMRNKFIICSGSISGDAHAYEKLLDLMISQREWKKCWDPSMDQPILNYLVWSGAVRRRGIKYKFTGCDDGFFTVQWCVLDRQEKMNEYGQLISEHGSVPSYIHQYNRLQSLSDNLYDKCGMTRQPAT